MATKVHAIPYAPETWTDAQRACHEADSLDAAFHAASCLAGGWYRRAVIIWCQVVDLDERYLIMPIDATAPEGYSRSYRVERCADE